MISLMRHIKLPKLEAEIIISELNFKAIRSSGSGGQHVNKVSSKVELSFDLYNSEAFTLEEKERLLGTLKNRLTKNKILILQCGSSRSQHKNKAIAQDRLINLIEEGLKVKKKRIRTKIPKSVTKKRLESKRKQASKKDQRKKPDLE